MSTFAQVLQPPRRPSRRAAGMGAGAPRGFTLIEMLTTMSVLVVTLALAAPSLGAFIRSSRIRTAQSELVSSLMLARSEAARRGVRVGVEAKAAADAGGLARGWRVWFDKNNNGAYDDSGGNELLRDVADLGASVTITSIRGSDSVRGAVFSPRGFLMPLAQVTMKVCGKPDEKGYLVSIQPAGMADISELAACS